MTADPLAELLERALDAWDHHTGAHESDTPFGGRG